MRPSPHNRGGSGPRAEFIPKEDKQKEGRPGVSEDTVKLLKTAPEAILSWGFLLVKKWISLMVQVI